MDQGRELMAFDIEAALAGTAPPLATINRCKIGRWIDDIPADTPGRDDLIRAIETTNRLEQGYRTGAQVDKILIRLGLSTSTKTIHDHRARRCRCYV